MTLSQSVAQQILKTFNVCPNFVETLRNSSPGNSTLGIHLDVSEDGELEHMGRVAHMTYASCSALTAPEFFCVNQSAMVFAPIYCYMDHELSTSCTTYLIFYSNRSSNIQAIKSRMLPLWQWPIWKESTRTAHSNAFLLHCLVIHELISNQRVHLNNHQSKLNLTLTRIREHVKESSSREKLKVFTIELNQLAQDFDVHSESLDRTLGNIDVLSHCKHQLEAASGLSGKIDSNLLLTESIEQLRTLTERELSKLSYLRSRMDTAMNLVSLGGLLDYIMFLLRSL